MLKAIILFAAINACWAAPGDKLPPGPVRPCGLWDKKCISDNLRANSRCSRFTTGGLPSKYVLKNVHFDTPYFNASYIDRTLIVRNHDKCFVSEFFFNVGADSAVLSIDCPRLDLEANRTLIQHNSQREDTEYNYHIRAEYPLIRLTTHLRHADRLDICSAFVFGEVTALPIFNVKPLDTATSNFLSTDLSFMNIYERESIFYRAPWLLKFFVNAYICNFGC